jgi:tripartite-type tricarboxylate transporter receptor subunit TctC
LNRAINAALTSPDVVAKLSGLGLDPATGTPEQFAKVVADDYAKWGPIVRASGFKPE